jgi:hypothetical protein
MSQTWEALDASGTVLAEVSKHDDKLDSLRTHFSGASEPSSTAAYQVWFDTATKLIKQRNAANGAWLTVGTLGSAAHVQHAFIRVGTVSASTNVYISGMTEAITITDVNLLCSTGVATDDTDYWSFMLANLTETEDLLSAAVTTMTTGGAAIVADTPFELAPDQNTALGADEVVELQMTKAASAGNLVDLTVVVAFYATGV